MSAPVFGLLLPPDELLALYLPAMLLCIAAPGPDMLLALSRGLGGRRLAAVVSATGTGFGIACHSVLLGLGLSALLQASGWAFAVLKLVGAGYLIWIGIRAIRSRGLISLDPAAAQPLHRIFLAGWLANLLNPKVAVFVVAFIPQFIDRDAGPVAPQMFALGALFALATITAYGALGCAAAPVGRLLSARPQWVARLNLGAGSMLVLAGLGVLALRQR